MKLFSWGPNICGQLGQGTMAEECRSPVEITIEGASFEDIIGISGGANHSFLVFKNGSVFFTGKDSLVTSGGIAPNFKSLHQLDNLEVSKVASMWESSLALTSQGLCFGWGSNNFGQLGLADKQVSELKLLTKEKIVDIAVGLRHCLILREDGVVLSAGSGKFGQLGRDASPGFRPVDRLKKVKKICCGMNHSLALTEEGKLFSWGSNKFGQLGLDPKVYDGSEFPVEVELPISETQVVNCRLISGWTHSGILTNEGELINWGRNNYGQLGDEYGPLRWRPEIFSISKFDDIAMGAEHNLGLVKNTLFAWGWNEHGSCAVQKEDNVPKPTEINLKNVVKLGVGTSQSFALTG